MLAAPPHLRPLRRLVTALRTYRAAGPLVVLVAGACFVGESPTDPASDGAVLLDLRPSFAVSAADASALPVNRIRYSVVAVSSGARLVDGFQDVDPGASAWEMTIELVPPTSPIGVVVRTQLVNVDAGGREETQFSGITDTIMVEAGASVEAGSLDVIRGPLANLHVTRVEVTSDLQGLVEGEGRSLTRELESDGTVDASELVTYWTSLDTAVATVDGTTAVARRAGSTSVVATVGAISDTVPVSVRGPVATVVITPDSAVLVEGESVQLSAVLRTADGDTLEGVATDWSSGDPNVASVDSTGTVVGLGPGTTAVTATSDGVSGDAIVRVVRYALSSTYVTAPNSELVTGSFSRPPTPHVYVSTNLLTGTSDVEVTSTGPIATSLGGQVDVEADGDFAYRPPAGLAPGDQDTFQLVSTGDVSTTVTVDIQGAAIWYVDNGTGSAGSGRSHDPFPTLAEAEAAAGTGEMIYVSRGDGTTTGQDQGIALLDGQSLLGSGVALSVAGMGTLATPGIAPVITSAAGTAVTLADGNRVAGFTIDNPTGAAVEASASAGGQLDSLSVVASTGAALRFVDATGTWSSADLDITASAPDGGVVVLRGDPVLTLDLADSGMDNLPGGGAALQVDSTSGGVVTVQGGPVRERGAGILVRGAAGSLTMTSFLDVDTTSSDGLFIRQSPGAMRFDSVDIATVGSSAIFTSSNPGTLDIVGRVEARGDYGWNAQCTGFSPPSCGEINARFSAFRVLNDGIGARSRGLFMARTPAFLEIDTLDIFVGDGWTAGAGIQFLDMSYGGSLTIGSPDSRVAAPTLSGLDLLAGTQFGNPTGVNFTVQGTLAYLEGGAATGYSGSVHCLCGIDGSLTVADGLGPLTARGGSLALTLGGTRSFTADSLSNTDVVLTGAVEGVSLTGSANSSLLIEGTLAGSLIATGNPGSTVEATAGDNVASSASGPAVWIEDTEIGPAGVTLRSVSAISDALSPSSGIILRGTGTAGSLTVTGTGAAGSGGVIDMSTPPASGDPPPPGVLVDGSTTAGAYVGASADLAWLDIPATVDGRGIEAIDADLTLRNVTTSGAAAGLDVTAAQPVTLGVFDAVLSGAGTGTTPATIDVLPGATLDATIQRSTFQNGVIGLRMQATSAGLTASLTENLYASNASYGLYAASLGDPAASVTVTSTDDTFDDNVRGPRSVMGPGADSEGFVDVTLVRPQITGPGGGAQTLGATVWSYRPNPARLSIVGPAQISGYGRSIWGGGTGTVELEVDGATITSSDTAAVDVEGPFESRVDVRNTTIDGVTCGNGIRLRATGGSHRFTLENNTVRNVDCDHGVSVVGSGPTDPGAVPTEYVVSMTGNDIVMPAVDGLLGIELAGRTGRSVGCFDIRANSAVGGLGGAGIGLQDDPPPGGEPAFLLERLLGGSGTTTDPAVVEGQLEADNPGTTASDATSAAVSGVPDAGCATYFDVANIPPIAEPGGPYVAEVGSSVLFDGSASADAEPGRITSYEWFVDGSSVSFGSDPTFLHRCATEGRFDVQLVVTDDRGDTSSRSTLLDCQVTRFLARWLDAAGDPVTSAPLNEPVELQLCFLENDLSAFQAEVMAFRFSFQARVDSVAELDSSQAGTHPDCAGNADVLGDVTASADLTQDFTVAAVSTATGPGAGPQGVLSLYFTFTTPGVFDESLHAGLFSQVILETFDGAPPPFVLDLPDLTVN